MRRERGATCRRNDDDDKRSVVEENRFRKRCNHPGVIVIFLSLNSFNVLESRRSFPLIMISFRIA